MSPAHLTTVPQQLEQRGLVDRSENPTDRGRFGSPICPVLDPDVGRRRRRTAREVAGGIRFARPMSTDGISAFLNGARIAGTGV